MPRRILSLLGFSLGACVLALALFARAQQTPPPVIVLPDGAMGPVTFQHSLHVERAGNRCATCHHPSKRAKPLRAPQQACEDCHTRRPAPPMKTSLQGAFHNPTATAGLCIDCHKLSNARGKRAPLRCMECHKRSSA